GVAVASSRFQSSSSTLWFTQMACALSRSLYYMISCEPSGGEQSSARTASECTGRGCASCSVQRVRSTVVRDVGDGRGYQARFAASGALKSIRARVRRGGG